MYYFTLLVQNEWQVQRTNHLTDHLKVALNESQRQAVNKALNETFTLVWGPPGNYYSTKLPFYDSLIH